MNQEYIKLFDKPFLMFGLQRVVSWANENITLTAEVFQIINRFAKANCVEKKFF